MGIRACRGCRLAWDGVLSALVIAGLLLGSVPIIFDESPRGLQPSSSPNFPIVSLALTPSDSLNVSLSSVTNFTPAIRVSPLFYGVNIRSDEPFTLEDALALADTSTLTWRFPGGTIAESYNYSSNVDESSLRAEKNSISNFAGLCVREGCHAILQLPAEINDPVVDAYYVYWVEQKLSYTVNGSEKTGFTPTIWEFGNEPSLWPNFNQSWAQWGTLGTNATPTQYAQIVPSIVAAIRSVDPTTPIDPLGGVGGNPADYWPWVQDVMAAAQTTVQYLSIHSYFGGSQKSSNASFYSPLYTGSYTLNKLIPSLYGTVLGACPGCTNVQLLVSEAGASTKQANSAYEAGFQMDMWDSAEVIQTSLSLIHI